MTNGRAKETAFYNGVVYTADEKLPQVQAFVVRDGRFISVANDADVRACANKIDLRGRCVIPGLVDSHCHILSGLVSAGMNMITLRPGIRPEELADELLSHAEPDGEDPVIAMGIELTQGVFSADNIDAAFGACPVMVFSMDGHALLLNHRAMEELHIDRNVVDPGEGSCFVRDADGEPTGLVIEIPAMMRCRALAESGGGKDAMDEVLAKLLYSYAALGYTTVFDAMSADGEAEDVFPVLREFAGAGRMTLRLAASFCYHGKQHFSPEEALEAMRALRQSCGFADLRADTLKLIADGTVEEHSALLFAPYADRPGHFGGALIEPEDMMYMARLAAAEGFHVHIHAIGDRAVSRALDTLTALGPVSGTKTIAHNQLYREQERKRMVQAGDIFFQTTPHWMTQDDYTLARLGEERYGRQFPVGTMQRRGVPISFGSDAGPDEPQANAFLGMYHAVARGDSSECEGLLPPLSQGISREEALKAYTITGARQLGWGDETGSICAGKNTASRTSTPLRSTRSAFPLSPMTIFRLILSA